ncbi:MAG: sigma-54 dependent transcriptional regulator [Pseudomonadales bacterium]|nr:sigma-54 dependent transcriptional regulator [Pseudomonadales bacterium]
MHNVLILDDDEYVLKSLARLFAAEDYALSRFQDPMEALIQCTTRSFDLIISDQRMPGMTGTEFFAQVAEVQPETRRLLISGYSDFESVTDAFNQQIIHKFIVKPWNNDQLRSLVAEQLALKEAGPGVAVAPSGLSAERASAQPSDEVSFHGIVTSDQALNQQIAIIRQTATSEAPFFIHGETGTGKELIARAIHLESERATQAFVALNCANLTESLLESQLFGHKKGAFTGADKDQKGLLAEAEGGTLFLDEVTEIPLPLQAKLLRVLQEREYSPVGETRVIPFDVKVISASSTSLEQAVGEGNFREDLRYRLEVMPISLPPLRARTSDKGMLFDYFLENQLERHGHKPMLVDEAVYGCIDSYPWPGNVREMVNVCTYVAALATEEESIVTLEKLPPTLRAPAGSTNTQAAAPAAEPKAQRPQVTRESLEEAIEKFDGHRETIAQHFGISRMTLWRKMKQFDLA